MSMNLYSLLAVMPNYEVSQMFFSLINYVECLSKSCKHQKTKNKK